MHSIKKAAAKLSENEEAWMHVNSEAYLSTGLLIINSQAHCLRISKPRILYLDQRMSNSRSLLGAS